MCIGMAVGAFADIGEQRGLRGMMAGDKEADAVSLESSRSKSRQKHAGEDNTVLGMTITHPDRILFAGQGVAKIDLARYYAAVAGRMLPYAADHPLSLVRCPRGPEKTCFFQKHAGDGFPDEIRTVPIREKSGETKDYLYVHDGAGIVAAVQMGTLEFHIWGSAIDSIGKPDRMIFDLDPDETIGFDRVRQAAFLLRDRLASLGLRSVPMVTGGKGVHVIVPLERRADWAAVKSFAKAFATRMAEEEPDRYTATMSREKRKGRVFIDWLRNERGATAVAPYSTRSREGAPVATPVSWEELEKLEAANRFHLADVLERIEAADPWDGSREWRQSVTKKMISGVGG